MGFWVLSWCLAGLMLVMQPLLTCSSTSGLAALLMNKRRSTSPQRAWASCTSKMRARTCNASLPLSRPRPSRRCMAHDRAAGQRDSAAKGTRASSSRRRDRTGNMPACRAAWGCVLYGQRGPTHSRLTSVVGSLLDSIQLNHGAPF